MYVNQRVYARTDMKMSLLVDNNPRIVLLLEHLEFDFLVADKTVAQIAEHYKMPIGLFLLFINLYNGFRTEKYSSLDENGVIFILRFLRNSHRYYKTDKYPEISGYIDTLQKRVESEEISLIKLFFSDYFNEVLEHLSYEEQVVFPYFEHLVFEKTDNKGPAFSANEYSEHHTDIESKISDLKNLLIKHLSIKAELPLRRRLIFALLELHFDLEIHALVEENILVPLIRKFETKQRNG